MKSFFSGIGSVLKFLSDHFKGLVFLVILYILFAPSTQELQPSYNLQKIKLTGTIMDVSEVLETIEKAKNNDAVEGVLIEVNSPGGAVAPSVELSYAIKALAQKKPVVVYGSGMMASGGYYASIWANKIVANPGSMVGSIGVIMQGANFEGLMKKLGIKTQVIKAGKYKQVGTPDRAWTSYEKAELKKVINDTYAMFVEDVAHARGLKIAKKAQWADAHIFTARQAKEVGLVDIVGVESDAKVVVEKLSGVTNPQWNKEDKVDKFLKKLTAKAAVLLQTYFPPVVMR